MLNACIFIKTTPMRTLPVLEAVKQMSGVRKVFVAYGRFDLVAFIEVPQYNRIRLVSAEINGLEGVRSTETLPEA